MQPRILLAGMNKFPNQFSRYLESKGCETVRVSGDPGGHIPTDCEAVIITKCQISHEKFWKTKELYKDLDKPVFITDFGITPIRQRLEEFLKKFPKVMPTQEATVMSKAFTAALPTYMKNNDHADKIINEDYLKGLSAKDTLVKLKELRQADGSPYSINYIVSLRENIAMQFKPKTTTTSPVKPRAEIKSTKTQPSRERRIEKPKPDKAVDLFSSIWSVLTSGVSSDQKAATIWSLLNGHDLPPQIIIRKTDKGLQFFSTNPISNSESPLITLNQVQAIAIVQHLAQVEDYATDPNV